MRSATLPRRPQRKVRVVSNPAPQPDVVGTISPDSWVLKVLVADVVSYYEVTPSQFGPTWLVLKIGDNLDATLAQEVYKTTLDPDMGSSCTCPAGRFRGSCKHQDFLKVLTEAGRLPDLMKRKNEEE